MSDEIEALRAENARLKSEVEDWKAAFRAANRNIESRDVENGRLRILLAEADAQLGRLIRSSPGPEGRTQP